MTKRLPLCTQLFAEWKCHLPWINILSEWMSKAFEGEKPGCLYPCSKCDLNRRDLPSLELSSHQRTHAISGSQILSKDRQRLKQLVAVFFFVVFLSYRQQPHRMSSRFHHFKCFLVSCFPFGVFGEIKSPVMRRTGCQLQSSLWLSAKRQAGAHPQNYAHEYKITRRLDLQKHISWLRYD